MKKVILTAVLVVALVSQSQAGAFAAGCVTQGEFSKLRNGMSVSKVAKLFGTNGKRGAFARSGAYTSEVRSYVTCTPYGAVAVSFSNGKVSAKSGVF